MSKYLSLNLQNKRIENVEPTSINWDDENILKTRMVDDLNGLNCGFFKKQDFSAGDRVDSGSVLGTASNTNGQASYTAGLDPATTGGIFAYLYVGTTTFSTGSTHARGETGFLLNTAFCEYEIGFRIQLSALSSSSEEYAVQVGLSDSTSSGDELTGNNNICFRYARAIYGDVWNAITHKSDNTNVVTNTGISVSTSWVKFRIHVDRFEMAPRVRFYVDDILKATHTANIPVVGLFPRFAIKKSVGTTSRTARMEHIYHRMKFLNYQDRV